MKRFSAALVLAFVLLGTSTPSYAVEREAPRLQREPKIIKVIRAIVKIFQPKVLDSEFGPPKP